MIEDDESDIFFQLKPSKKIRKLRNQNQRLQKHYELLNQMSKASTEQEISIISLINTRLEFYSKSKQIMQWKENILESHQLLYVNLIKSESETFEDSECFFQQPREELSVQNYFD